MSQLLPSATDPLSAVTLSMSWCVLHVSDGLSTLHVASLSSFIIDCSSAYHNTHPSHWLVAGERCAGILVWPALKNCIAVAYALMEQFCMNYYFEDMQCNSDTVYVGMISGTVYRVLQNPCKKGRRCTKLACGRQQALVLSKQCGTGFNSRFPVCCFQSAMWKFGANYCSKI